MPSFALPLRVYPAPHILPVQSPHRRRHSTIDYSNSRHLNLQTPDQEANSDSDHLDSKASLSAIHAPGLEICLRISKSATLRLNQIRHLFFASYDQSNTQLMTYLPIISNIPMMYRETVEAMLGEITSQKQQFRMGFARIEPAAKFQHTRLSSPLNAATLELTAEIVETLREKNVDIDRAFIKNMPDWHIPFRAVDDKASEEEMSSKLINAFPLGVNLEHASALLLYNCSNNGRKKIVGHYRFAPMESNEERRKDDNDEMYAAFGRKRRIQSGVRRSVMPPPSDFTQVENP